MQDLLSKLPSAETVAEHARTARTHMNTLTDTIGAATQLYQAVQTASNVATSNAGRVEQEGSQRRLDDVVRRRREMEEKNCKSAAERREKSDKQDQEHREIIQKAEDDSKKALDENRKTSEEKHKENRKDVVEIGKHYSEQIAMENEEFQLKLRNLEIERIELEKKIAEKHQGDFEKKLEEEKKSRETFEEQRKEMETEHNRIVESILDQASQNQARWRADQEKFDAQSDAQFKKSEEAKRKIHQDQIARIKNENSKRLEQADKSFKLSTEHQVKEGNMQFLENTKSWLFDPMMDVTSALIELNAEIDFINEKGENAFNKEMIEEYIEPAAQNFDKCVDTLKQQSRKFSTYVRLSSDRDQHLRKVALDLSDVANEAIQGQTTLISKALETRRIQSLEDLRSVRVKTKALERRFGDHLTEVNSSRIFLTICADQTMNAGDSPKLAAVE